MRLPNTWCPGEESGVPAPALHFLSVSADLLFWGGDELWFMDYDFVLTRNRRPSVGSTRSLGHFDVCKTTAEDVPSEAILSQVGRVGLSCCECYFCDTWFELRRLVRW